MTRIAIATLAVLGLALGLTAGPAAGQSAELPPQEQEVQGTCATPRQAWLQLLWWLQKDGGRWDPEQAAMCLDASGLRDPARQGPERARMLKETLDSRGLWIEDSLLPTNPDYRDNDTGRHVYWEPASRAAFGRDVYLEKVDDRWLFSRETVARIPDIYPVSGLIERYMPEWMKVNIAGVDGWKFLLIMAIYLVVYVIRWIAMLIINVYVRGLVKRSRAAYLDKVVERAEKPLGLLIMALVFYICIPLLLLPIRLTSVAMLAIKAASAYAAVWLAYRLIDVLAEYLLVKAEKTETKLDDQLIPLIAKTLKVFVSVVGGIFILQNLEVNVGSLLAGLGLGGLAFALAAKDTIANFFGSIMIFIDKPFQIGDWVVIGSTEGIVEEVGFRTSRVRTFYNSLVTVPNAMITSTVVDNYGARKYRRYTADLGLTYDTPPDKVGAFCEGVRAVIAGMPGMRKDYYLVEFKGFGDSSLVIMIYCFMVAKTWNEELRIRTNLNLEILRLAENLGVSFAFPTRTLHVSSLAQPGESVPGHRGPEDREELAAIIDGFGPRGSLAQPEGLVISKSYDCGAVPPRSRDERDT
jgi:MscS family membrane protein